MAELLPRFRAGSSVPAFAATLVAAGHFVKVTGDKTAQGDYQVGHCAAGDAALGVAEYDSAPVSDPASSSTRRINVNRKCIARVVPGAAITAGAKIQSDATGRAITWASGVELGIAMQTVLSTAAFVEVDCH